MHLYVKRGFFKLESAAFSVIFNVTGAKIPNL